MAGREPSGWYRCETWRKAGGLNSQHTPLSLIRGLLDHIAGADGKDSYEPNNPQLCRRSSRSSVGLGEYRL